MVSENSVKDIIAQLQGTGKTFAEFLAEIFKDKIIEIYVGDTYETHNFEQISSDKPAVFCGKVIAAYRECLVLNCVYVSATKHAKWGNLVFVNERAIRALNEVDGNGTINDMMLCSKDTLLIKNMAEKK